jgi:hypothetical protein
MAGRAVNGGQLISQRLGNFVIALVFCAGLLVIPATSGAVCLNEALRSGPSALLPDCRAYELVSPPDSNGRTPLGLNFGKWNASAALFPTRLIATSGDQVAFLGNNGPVDESQGLNGALDVSAVQRLASGWKVTRHFSPGGDQAVQPMPGGISPDHAYAFSVATVPGDLPGGPLASEGVALYLANPGGSFEPAAIGSVGGSPVSERFAQGRYISEGGGHVIFSTGRLESGSHWCFKAESGCPVHRLADDAPPEGTGVIYDRAADGPTHVVSLLPGDAIPGAGEDAAYQGVSQDGTTVAFKIGATLYVRMPDAGDGETLKVAEGPTVFAGLSDHGRYLFYVAGGENGTVHRFDTESEADVEINPSAAGELVNISADGSHVYFISKESIGGGGIDGQPNLFVWSESAPAPSYIRTVAPSDLEKTSNDGIEDTAEKPALTNWTDGAVALERPSHELQGPGANSSRTTPDGTVLVFESKAKLTSYESAGQTEIYRYDDSDKSLVCVSCNFNVASASAGARLQQLALVSPPNVVDNLTADGSRVFFESAEDLVAADTDGINDIYEWSEEDQLELISSGHSQEYPALNGKPFVHQPQPNVIFAITPSGSDVVFLSQDELVPGAGGNGTPNLYDARVNGGFPAPQEGPICLEEGCRPLGPQAPGVDGLASEAALGAGNVKRHNRRCHHRSRQHVKRHHCSKHRSKKKAAASATTNVSIDSLVALQAPQPEDQGPVPSREKDVPVSGISTAPPVALAGEGFEEFGIESAGADLSPRAAGAHPDFTSEFTLNHYFSEGRPATDARTKDVTVSLPPGLLGNPNAIPKCSSGTFSQANCPLDSQVGIAFATTGLNGPGLRFPIYNLEPPHPGEEVARFGFYAVLYPVFIDIHVRSASDYGVSATVRRAPAITSLIAAKTVLWGNPADSSHDALRMNVAESITCGAPCIEAPDGKHASGISPEQRQAFMTNPSACQGGEVGFEITSYQLPGQLFTASAPLSPITDCTGLPFAPTFSAEPTSHVAGAPTGLRTKLVLPQHLLASERATATMREARVTLPEGMQVAAGAANWIGVCSDEQVGYHQEVDTACPNNSKLGTATITSPALSVPIEGTIYQRSPQPGHQFGLWLTADALGLHIKLPGELEPDKHTGRLTAVFRDLPQVPVEEIELNVWGGDRAPLENPDRCGTYTTDFSFAPHSNDPAAVGQSTMQITEGCSQGFSPSLKAGVTEPVAGKFSPFVVDLTRPDGNQALRGFELKLPDGELAKIKGVPLCSEADATAGTCPAASRIGSLQATTGPGPEPLAIPQPGKPQPQIYLAGPYKGAPFSILSEVPAQAGPFDLGTLAVRSGLEVEPETGRAIVKADPLPQFFEGVGIAYRHLHAVVDRPGFSLNPTDCREMAVTSDVTSTQGAVAHPSARFQVDGCKRLKFKPRLSLRLKGGTERADYPALTAVLRARKGDANIAFAAVALPHSEFLAQEHIATICTRKQFAADKCPKGSVYGRAKAITPLLDKPLAGPVYLRSSDHPLPDLVAKLGGQLEIDLVGRIDSKNGGIRTTFASVPDAPVSKFILQMKGGKKGLLTNSTDICRGVHRATGQMKAQNGRAATLRPSLQSSGCPKKKLGKHNKHH